MIFHIVKFHRTFDNSPMKQDQPGTEAQPAVVPGDGHFVDDYMPYLLARASHLLSAQFHERLADTGISVPVWRVLSTLSDRASLSIGELAGIVLLKQPTLSKILDRMLTADLVTRTPATDDRRRVNVAITDKGRAQIADLLHRAKLHEAEALKGYGAADIANFKLMLRTMIERLAEPWDEAGDRTG